MYRQKDSRNGTGQDVFHLCSALERLFLYHPPDSTPCVQLLNYFELLFQSARTRICVFYEPEEGAVLTEEVVQDLVVVTTFRSCDMHKLFVERLTEALAEEGRQEFLNDKCVALHEVGGSLYFLLVRVNPFEKDMSLERRHSNESYFRLESLFRKLEEERAHWGLDIKRAIFNCLTHMHHKSRWVCARSLPDHDKNPKNQPVVLRGIPFPEKPFPAIDKQAVLDRLKALKYWVEDVYELLEEMLLTGVADPVDTSKTLPFHNVFFFQRVNVSQDSNDCSEDCDIFEIRNVVPQQQRQQLSVYYHKNQANSCQYYQQGGGCALSGMGACVVKPYWDSAKQELTQDEIYVHYSKLWHDMEQILPASSFKVAAAFESRSIVFDRRHEYTDESGARFRVKLDDSRDQVAACLRHRIIQTEANKGDSGSDFPQLLFVPLYAGSEPVMAVATVVNVAQSSKGDIALSEWRRAFRFADYALGHLSERLQESLRRIYMNEAVDLLHKRFIESELLVQENPSITHIELRNERKLLSLVQNDFDLLARSLPFRRISLALHTQSVIKRQLQCGVFTTAWHNKWQIHLEKNPYWRFGSDHDGLDLEFVVKKFTSCMLRATAYRDRENRDKRRFLAWFIKMRGRSYDSSLNLGLNWRQEAYKLGWPG